MSQLGTSIDPFFSQADSLQLQRLKSGMSSIDQALSQGDIDDAEAHGIVQTSERRS